MLVGGASSVELGEDLRLKAKCRFFLVSKELGVMEWFPPECGETLPTDCRYFGGVFAEMEKLLPDEISHGPLHVYLTYDLNVLPEYGPHVVVLLLAEEYGLIPRYVRHVRAVFKTHRLRPVFGSKTWWRLDHYHFVLWVKFCRNWILHLRSRWNASFVPREWPYRIHRKIQVQDVPVGYGRQELLDPKPMGVRPYHSFFAGQVNLDIPFWRRQIPSPKVFARRKMFAAVQEMIARDARFRFDGGEVTDAGASTLRNSRSYSQRMMDSKICLAPRGTAIDTLRFFEGLRAGCLVVCDHLTDEWFYAGAPVLRVKDWDDLPEIVAPYLYDDSALERARVQSLSWWNEVCCEKAIGRVMAEYLIKTGERLNEQELPTFRPHAKRSIQRRIASAFRVSMLRCLGNHNETN
jgi:hypothetical protein